MSDIVERLRELADKADVFFDGQFAAPWREAADEIERLRVALHQIAGKVSQSDKLFDGDMASDIARAALGEEK